MEPFPPSDTEHITPLLKAVVHKLSGKDWRTLYESWGRGCHTFEDGAALAIADFMAALRAAVAGDASALQLTWARDNDVPDTATCEILEWCRGQLLQALTTRPAASRREQQMSVEDFHAWLEVVTVQWVDERASAISGEAGLRILQTLVPCPQTPPASCDGRRSMPMIIAARKGLLDHVQWLLPSGHTGEWDSGECANLIAVTPAWQKLKRSPPNSIHARFGSAALCTLAAEMQDLNLLSKLRAASPPCPFDTETAAALARSDSTGCMRALHQLLIEAGADTKAKGMAHMCAQAAAKSGSLQTLQWLWKDYAPERAQKIPNNESWTMDVIQAAISGGHARVFKWTWDRCPASVWHHEADCREQAGLQWLVANYLPCRNCTGLGGEAQHSPEAFTWRAISMRPELPEPHLLSNIPLDAYACRQAAAYGNVELLAWLRGKGCPWDVRACNLAARHGHLKA